MATPSPPFRHYPLRLSPSPFTTLASFRVMCPSEFPMISGEAQSCASACGIEDATANRRLRGSRHLRGSRRFRGSK